MKVKYLICFILMVVSCKVQTNNQRVKTKYVLRPPFKNQREQEHFWAQQIFQKEYKYTIFQPFQGNIKMNENKVMYNNEGLELINIENKFESIFTNGILYPELFGDSNLKITNLEELDFLSLSPHIKRFSCTIHQSGWMGNNQVVFVFELTNIKANSNTDFKEFTKGSHLTFLKKGWIEY